MSGDQLQPEDTLDDRGVEDVLDEGYSPPEREPDHLKHPRAESRSRSASTTRSRRPGPRAEEEPTPTWSTVTWRR